MHINIHMFIYIYTYKYTLKLQSFFTHKYIIAYVYI